MTVYVCPTRDIECGSNPAHWCHTCPQQHRTEPDCRTCQNIGRCSAMLMSLRDACFDGDKYQPLPPVRLYRSKT